MAKIFRCEYQWHVGSIYGVTGWHRETDLAALVPTPDEPTASELAQKEYDAHFTTFQAACATSVAIDQLYVREEVATWLGEVPATGVKTISSNGTQATADTKLDEQLTILVKIATAAAIRSGRGALWMPPPLSTAHLTATGDFNAASGAGLNCINWLGALDNDIVHTLLSVEQYRARLGVYSRTRRVRADSPYFFRATSTAMRTRPHWLRSRVA